MDDKKPGTLPPLFGQQTSAPFKFEFHGDATQHTIVIGPTGNGKARLHSELLDAAIKGRDDGAAS